MDIEDEFNEVFSMINERENEKKMVEDDFNVDELKEEFLKETREILDDIQNKTVVPQTVMGERKEVNLDEAYGRIFFEEFSIHEGTERVLDAMERVYEMLRRASKSSSASS